jgi:hypothetical protein
MPYLFSGYNLTKNAIKYTSFSKFKLKKIKHIIEILNQNIFNLMRVFFCCCLKHENIYSTVI